MIVSTQEQQEQFEENWLQWARSVLISGPCKVCTSNDGTIFDRVLWPGYIGRRYSKGRVLLVGAVHNAKELPTWETIGLATVAESWARRSFSDADYLDEVTRAYRASACKWIKKGVWKGFQQILAKLNLSWDEVAFTNWSKCKAVSGNNLYNKHLNYPQGIFDRLPISELCPLAVFVCCGKGSVVSEVENARLKIPIIRLYQQRNRRSEFPPTHDAFAKWLDADASAYNKAVADARERTGNHAQAVPAWQQQLTAAQPARDATVAHVAAAGAPAPVPRRANDTTYAVKASSAAKANPWRKMVLRPDAIITKLGNTSRPGPDSKSHRMYSSLQNGQTVARALAAKDHKGKQACNSDYLKWFIYKGFVRQD